MSLLRGFLRKRKGINYQEQKYGGVAKRSHSHGYRRSKISRKISPDLDAGFKQSECMGSFAVEIGAARAILQNILKGFFYASLMVLTFMVVLWFFREMNDPEKFLIQRIEFAHPPIHVRASTLQAMSLSFVGESFFSVNINALKERLGRLPWVAQVTVLRVWPNALSVSIKEQVAVARLQGNQLLNQKMKVFSVPASTIPKNLPEFKGSTGQLELMWQNYRAIEKLLQPIGLHVVYLELSSRQAWRLRLDNGLTLILGRLDGLDHLSRFVGVYNQVLSAQNLSAVDYIDLRYSNGMAVHAVN